MAAVNTNFGNWHKLSNAELAELLAALGHKPTRPVGLGEDQQRRKIELVAALRTQLLLRRVGRARGSASTEPDAKAELSTLSGTKHSEHDDTAQSSAIRSKASGAQSRLGGAGAPDGATARTAPVGVAIPFLEKGAAFAVGSDGRLQPTQEQAAQLEVYERQALLQHPLAPDDNADECGKAAASEPRDAAISAAAAAASTNNLFRDDPLSASPPCAPSMHEDRMRVSFRTRGGETVIPQEYGTSQSIACGDSSLSMLWRESVERRLHTLSATGNLNGSLQLATEPSTATDGAPAPAPAPEPAPEPVTGIVAASLPLVLPTQPWLSAQAWSHTMPAVRHRLYPQQPAGTAPTEQSHSQTMCH
eukprot:SAG31_NODE_1884_length_6996_cov_4.386835_3_plen_361_part_00